MYARTCIKFPNMDSVAKDRLLILSKKYEKPWQSSPQANIGCFRSLSDQVRKIIKCPTTSIVRETIKYGSKKNDFSSRTAMLAIEKALICPNMSTLSAGQMKILLGYERPEELVMTL